MKMILTLALTLATSFGFAANTTNTRRIDADAINGVSESRNYIKNGDAEDASPKWTCYADAAATRPVDGTGGSPSATMTRTSNAIERAYSWLMSKGATNRQGDGCAYPFSIDNGDQAKVLQIDFDYMAASGSFTPGSNSTESDIIVYLYDVTNSTLIEPSSIKLFSNSTTLSDHFTANFQTSATGVSYRLIMHIGSTNASGYTMIFDNFSVKRAKYVYGTPISDWITYTPTGALTVTTTYTGRYRRVGSSAEVMSTVKFSGAPTGTTVTMAAPTFLALDTTADQSTGTPGAMCTWYGSDSGVQDYTGTGYISGTSCLPILSAGGQVTKTSPFSIGANDYYQVRWSFPVLGWNSSVQTSDASDQRTTVARYSTAGTNAAANGTDTILNFDTKSIDTHAAVTTGASWKFTAPTYGFYKVYASIRTAAYAYTAGKSVGLIIKKTDLAAAQTSVGTHYTTLQASATQQVDASIADIVELKAGEYIQVYWNQDSGGSLNLVAQATQDFITIEKVQGPSTISSTETIAAIYKTAAGTSIANNSAQIANYATVEKDTHNAVTTGASWKFTAPAAGLYHVSATNTLAIGTSTALTYLLLELYKNGSVVATGPYLNLTTTASVGSVGNNINTEVYLNAGDYIDIRITQSSGGAKSLDAAANENRISIYRIGI